MECPRISLRDVVLLFGITYETAKNRLCSENFAVPVRKEGRLLVVDKAVIEAYFDKRRAEDLARLSSSSEFN